MKKPQPLVTVLIVAGVLWLGAGLYVRQAANHWVALQVKKQIASKGSVGPIDWVSPSELKIEEATVLNPSGCQGPYFLKVKEILVKFPEGISLWRAPVAQITMKSPHLMLEPINLISIWSWDAGPKGSGGLSQTPRFQFPFVIQQLHIEEGKMEFADRRVRPDGSLFLIDHVQLGVLRSGSSAARSVQLTASGTPVSPEGKALGFIRAACQLQSDAGFLEGQVTFRHERLSDFRRLYYFSPQPLYLDDGKVEMVVDWKIENVTQVFASVHIMAQDLRVEGMAGNVPWSDILGALQDEKGRIDLTTTASGSLTDPAFNLHDRLLSELEWTIRERIGAKGIRVPGRIFFGLMKKNR